MQQANSPRAQQVVRYMALAARHRERAECAMDIGLAESYLALATGYEQLARAIDLLLRLSVMPPRVLVRRADSPLV
jgi:hypothetical protein